MIVLATDLDRTLLPNGKDEYDNTLSLLFNTIREKEFILVYVTGRNIGLFKEAKKEFEIEIPDYMIGDVGTMIYKKVAGKLIPDNEWLQYLKTNAPNWDVEKIKDMITTDDSLAMQEESKQNKYKLSYYLDNLDQKEKIIASMEKALDSLDMDGDIIYSFDPLKNIGLVDVLPRIATKVTALEFLRDRMDESKNNFIFCGDSGNDILALTNGYKSVLVRNAPENIKEEAKRINKEKGFEDKLYIAKGVGKLNGNYSSGIIEGLVHFEIITEDDLKI